MSKWNKKQLELNEVYPEHIFYLIDTGDFSIINEKNGRYMRQNMDGQYEIFNDINDQVSGKPIKVTSDEVKAMRSFMQ